MDGRLTHRRVSSRCACHKPQRDSVLGQMSEATDIPSEMFSFMKVNDNGYQI
jgi:hypothetical protein